MTCRSEVDILRAVVLRISPEWVRIECILQLFSFASPCQNVSLRSDNGAENIKLRSSSNIFSEILKFKNFSLRIQAKWSKKQAFYRSLGAGTSGHLRRARLLNRLCRFLRACLSESPVQSSSLSFAYHILASASVLTKNVEIRPTSANCLIGRS